MKAMMDKPHTIRLDDKLIDDFVLEPTRHAMHRSRIPNVMPFLLILFVLLVVIRFVFER